MVRGEMDGQHAAEQVTRPYDLEERTAVLQRLYFDNYPKADTVFRKEAKEVVEALLASDVPTWVVTNSATNHVQEKIDRLDPKGREALRVIGNARKFIVTDPETPDPRFDQVPETVTVADLDRSVLVEAQRQGVLHKGRVAVRDGRLSDVELSPAYSIFP